MRASTSKRKKLLEELENPYLMSIKKGKDNRSWFKKPGERQTRQRGVPR